MSDTAETNAAALNIGWVLISGFLVFFMQAGFAMLEAGSVSSKNALNILFKNICDACISAIGFWVIGYGVAYGKSENGFIGTSDYGLRGDQFTPSTGIDDGEVSNLYFQWWFFQWAFAATAATIVSGSVAERCKLDAYYIYSAVVTIFIYPVVVCWCWGDGWLSPFQSDINDFQFDGKDSYSFIDFAGSGVVHMTGGILGLIGAVMIGPRKGRFNEDGSVNDMPGHNMTVALLGVLILWFGWYGFNCGSTGALSGATAAYVAAKVAATTTIAAATSGLTQILYQKFILGSQDLGKVGNAILAGLVSITAPCSTVDLWAAFMIGIIGCVFYNFASAMLLKLQIDDPLDASPIHGFCGLWGVLAVGIFATDKNAVFAGYNSDALDDTINHGPLETGEQFGVQLVGALSIIGWVSVTGAILFAAIDATIGLRVDAEQEEAGLDSSEHGAAAYNLAPNTTNVDDVEKVSVKIQD